jgi:hypothetical protein
MATVDPPFAQWLQDEASFLVPVDQASALRWGASAQTAERVSAIATRAGAEVEAQRQLAFHARGPFAVEEHQLVGTDWQRELGRIVTLTINELGYDDGLDVFVVGAEADRVTGLSTVTVLRPLRVAA